MRLVALSDIHGSLALLSAVAAEVAGDEVDVVAIAGDLTDFGGAKETAPLLELARAIGTRLVAVPGNCDRRGAREALTASGSSIDDAAIIHDGLLFAGSGGALIRSGLTPYERHEEELERGLETALAKNEEAGLGDLPLVVITHMPPRSSGADLVRGASHGSRALRRFLDKRNPLLWICGHIHESRSATRVGSTLVVNPGPLSEGNYALVDVDRGADGAWRAEAELRRAGSGRG